MTDSSCIFCKIVAGQIPSYKIAEEENAVAILDAFPMTEGHCLVLPKKHCATIDGIADEDALAAMRLVRQVSSQMMTTLDGVTGINVCQNNGRSAGQIVDHVHFHLIPRRSDDGLLKYPPSASQMIQKDLALSLLEKMKPVKR